MYYLFLSIQGLPEKPLKNAQLILASYSRQTDALRRMHLVRLNHTGAPLPVVVLTSCNTPIHWQSILKSLLAGINPVLTLLRWLFSASSGWGQSTCPVLPKLWGTVPRLTPGVNVSRSGRELDDIARMVVDWMVPEGNQVVCPDRTNRDFGLFKINIMMVAKQQVVIPAKESVAKAGTIQLELISLQLHLSPHSPFISRFVTKLSLTERSGLVRNHARIESLAASSL